MNEKKPLYIRKNKLVQKKIQLSAAAFVVGISLVSFLLLCAVVFGVSEYVSLQIKKDIEKLENAVAIQHTIVSAIDTFSKSISSSSYELEMSNILKDSENGFTIIDSHIQRISLFVRYHILVLLALLIIQIVFFIFLFRYTIHLTYRFCGPEKVLVDMIRKIRKGEKVRIRPLRNGDHLQHLYAELTAFAEERDLVQK